MNKIVDNLLIALMFNEPLPQEFSHFTLTAKFKEEFNEIFKNTEPISTSPGNQPLPPEMPRYILQTNDKKNEFIFTGDRFNFNFNITSFESTILDGYIASIENVLRNILQQPFRIGIVINGIVDTNGNLNDFLKDYIDTNILSNSEEYQVSYRSIIGNNGYNCNKWIRYGALKNNDKVNFQLDINSINGIEYSQLTTIYRDIISKEIGDYIGR